MDLIKAQNALKNLSDDQLAQRMKTPGADVPQFLVMSELTRRKTLRDEARAQPQPSTSIAEEMTMGLGSMAQSEPQVQGYQQGGRVWDKGHGTGRPWLTSAPSLWALITGQHDPRIPPYADDMGLSMAAPPAAENPVRENLEAARASAMEPYEGAMRELTRPNAGIDPYFSASEGRDRPHIPGGPDTDPIPSPPGARPLQVLPSAEAAPMPPDPGYAPYGYGGLGHGEVTDPWGDAYGDMKKIYGGAWDMLPGSEFFTGTPEGRNPLQRGLNAAGETAGAAAEGWLSLPGEAAAWLTTPTPDDPGGDPSYETAPYGYGGYGLGDVEDAEIIESPGAPVEGGAGGSPSVDFTPGSGAGGSAVDYDARLKGGSTPEGIAELDKIMAEFDQMMGDFESQGEQDKWLALAQMGFGIAGGESPYFATNVGQGGAAGMEALSDLNRQQRAMKMKGLGVKADLSMAKDAMRQGHEDLAIKMANLAIQERAAQSKGGLSPLDFAEEYRNNIEAQIESVDKELKGIDPLTGDFIPLSAERREQLTAMKERLFTELESLRGYQRTEEEASFRPSGGADFRYVPGVGLSKG